MKNFFLPIKSLSILLLITSSGISYGGERYEYIDYYGNVISASEDASCVKDLESGLYWQPTSSDMRYSIEGESSIDQYISKINTVGLCGKYGWRLPTIDDMSSIIIIRNISASEASIDTNFFPDTSRSFYLTSSEYATDNSKVWSVNFTDGSRYITDKITPHLIRLVHD